MLIPHQTAYKLRYPKVTVLSTSAITDAMGPAGWLDERYLEVIRVFDTFHNKSGLTDLGEDVRLRLQKVWENARGRGGNLTPLGERQHKAIAKRLYQPPYIPGQRQHISAFERFRGCIMSMSAFTEQLKELNPSLQITREANQRHMDYIAYTSPEAEKLGSANCHGEQLSIHSKKIIFIRNV